MKIGKIGNATLPNIFHHINYVPPNAGLGYGIIASQLDCENIIALEHFVVLNLNVDYRSFSLVLKHFMT